MFYALGAEQVWLQSTLAYASCRLHVRQNCRHAGTWDERLALAHYPCQLTDRLLVYSANLWNAFDIAFITIYMSYTGFRFYGLYYGEEWARNLGVDILALGACLMFPR